jgi:hypothetical protein
MEDMEYKNGRDLFGVWVVGGARIAYAWAK